MSNLDYHLNNPAPIAQSDVDVIRSMNPRQREILKPFDVWPEWAKRDAQILANYRQQLNTNSRPG